MTGIRVGCTKSMERNLGRRLNHCSDGFDCTAQAEVDPEGTAASTVLGEQHDASTGGMTRLREQFRDENRIRDMRRKKENDEYDERRKKEDEEFRRRWEKSEEDSRRYWVVQMKLMKKICELCFGGNQVVDNSPLAGTELAGTGRLHSLADEINVNSPVLVEQRLEDNKSGMDNSPLAGTELAGTGRLHSLADEINVNSPVLREQRLDENNCCDTGEEAVVLLLRGEQLSDRSEDVMPEASGPGVLEKVAIEPRESGVHKGVHLREPVYGLHRIVSGSEVEPQIEERCRQKEKPIVQALVVDDHEKASENMDPFEIVEGDGSSSFEQDMSLVGSRGASITGGFVEELMGVFESKSLKMRMTKEKDVAKEEMELRLTGRSTLGEVLLDEQPAKELLDKVVMQKLEQKFSKRERQRKHKWKHKWQGKSGIQVLAQTDISRRECSKNKRQTVVREEKTELGGLEAREEEAKLDDFGIEQTFLGMREEEDLLKDLDGEKELYFERENQVESESLNIKQTETSVRLEYGVETSFGNVAEQIYQADKMKEGVGKSRRQMKRVQKWKIVPQVELELKDMQEKMVMKNVIAVPGAVTELVDFETVVQKQFVVAEPWDRNNADSSLANSFDSGIVDSSMAVRKVEEKGDNTQNMTIGLGKYEPKAEAVEVDNLCRREGNVEKKSYVSELEEAVSVSSQKEDIGENGRDKQLKQERSEQEGREQLIAKSRCKTKSRGKNPLDKCWRRSVSIQQEEKFFVRTGKNTSRVEIPSVKVMAEESNLCSGAGKRAEVALVMEQKKPNVEAVFGDHADVKDPVEETMEEVKPRVRLEQILQGPADENLVEGQGVLVIPHVPGKEDDAERLMKLNGEESRFLGGKLAERQQLWLGGSNYWTKDGDIDAGIVSLLIVMHALGVVNLEEGNLEAIMQWNVSCIIFLCYLLYFFFGRSGVSDMLCTSLRYGAGKDSLDEEKREETGSSKAGVPNYDKASWLFKRWKFTEAGRTVLTKSIDSEQQAARNVVASSTDQVSREAVRTVLDRRKGRVTETDQLKQTFLLNKLRTGEDTRLFFQFGGDVGRNPTEKEMKEDIAVKIKTMQAQACRNCEQWNNHIRAYRENSSQSYQCMCHEIIMRSLGWYRLFKARPA